ncbi:substrate-binding domain-containing protein [Microbacterium ulmi]|uniref:LacI family DNA-binding transcriptional regulator n=1 Tax=Microbacterium ulmi TaxID=179095 RepID=A0A7Y2Q1K0_9MICO|nr:LacI family transcriptional regulator [Microbacterium ulmi]NNH04015.1 LacI family DNA-binding transcriptional regulator [Microbacterium ulmi]
MTRIADVANLAGVSTATVSRVLNGIPVRGDSESRVRAAVAELGYSRDRTARSLRRRHSELLALVVPDISNPFFTGVARGVEDVASDAGYSVVICNTDELPAKESRYLQIAEDENVAGVIIAPASAEPALTGLLRRGRVVVVIDRAVDLPVDEVIFDNYDLGYRATSILLEQGYRRIACVTGPETTPTAVERARGWKAAMGDAGIDAPDEILKRVPFYVGGGRAAMESLNEGSQIDAVVATNNLVGVGVLQSLAETERTGIVGVCVIGDLPYSTTKTSQVHVLQLNPREMGGVAARMLLERIDGLADGPRSVRLAATGPTAR